jgi:hypothetical protein
MREIAYFGADLRGARCAAVVPFGTTFFLEAGAETARGVVSNGTREIHRVTIPSRQLSVRTRDSHGFGRCQAGRNVVNVLTTSSKLSGGMRCERGSGAYRRISLGGAGRRFVGFTLRGHEEGIKGVLLTLKRMRMGKRIVFVKNLYLREKV